MKLRDYQQQAVEAVLESWKSHRSCVVVLPTGCGKTVVFAEIIRRRLAENSRVMVLAHREELITQAQEKIRSLTDSDVLIEMGAFSVDDFFGKMPPVIVSTVQTQITGRIGKFLPEDFATLVIDEAHHATSKSYRSCIEHYFENPDCRLLGVTATPDRADEKALGLVFDHVAFSYSVADAIRDGWLVPVRQKLVKVGDLDFSGISTTAGDFNQGELAEVLEEEKNLHAVAIPTLEICGSRRAIIFCASVKQADRLAEIINRFHKGRAQWLCGKTPKDERHQMLEDFKSGKTQFLVNVGVLTEGFDDAGVEVVVMARPTKSRALYAQMAGRATRPAADIAPRLGDHDVAGRRALIAKSAKPQCLIVDFVGNSGRHKLVSTADILGGNFDEDDEDEQEARRRARKACEESPDGADMAEELAKAREQIRANRLNDEERRKFITATARFVSVDINPFDIFDLAPVDETEKSKLDQRPLSWKQRRILIEKMRIDPDKHSAAECRAMLDAYFANISSGRASYGQRCYLRKHGYPAPTAFDEASRMIGRLMGNKRWWAR